MPGIPAEERAENGLQQSLYLPRTDKIAKVICEEGKRPAPRCELDFAVMDDLTASASIPRNAIDDYAEIEERIRASVKSIRQQQ